MEIEIHGPQPENILYLVREVFETLISEFYKGIYYFFRIPCFKCIKEKENDISMIESYKITRAIKLNAPFIQCSENFHILSINQLQSIFFIN